MMNNTKVVWLLISTLVNSIAFSLISPFVPIELQPERGGTLGLVGVAFSVYPLAVLTFTPLFTRFVPTVGTTNIISVAIALTGAIFIAYGFLFDQHMEDKEEKRTAVLITLTMALRLFQGMTCACVQAACIVMAQQPLEDCIPGQDSKMRILTWITNVTIIGFIFGPLFGSSLYSCLGQMNTFFIVGSFLVFLAVIIKMNFNGDAGVGETDCDDNYLGDN